MMLPKHSALEEKQKAPVYGTCARCHRVLVKIFFDGGCRPNPGEMETAVVGRGKVYHQRLGFGSSEQAEWLALLHALKVARLLGAPVVHALGDSASVINQANGLSKCRDPELQRCLAAFREEAGLFERLRVRHIKRTQNLAGIALARARNGSST